MQNWKSDTLAHYIFYCLPQMKTKSWKMKWGKKSISLVRMDQKNIGRGEGLEENKTMCVQRESHK